MHHLSAEEPPPLPAWLLYLLDDTSALQLMFWMVALVALLAGLVKLWPLLSRGVQIVNAVSGLPAFITETKATLAAQDRKLEGIYHETHKNDGSSVKDAVDRIEEGVAGLHVRIEELASADVDFAEKLASDHDRLKALEDTQPRNPKETP